MDYSRQAKIDYYFQEKKDKINRHLEEIIKENSLADEAANYYLLGRGNRWRPVLSLSLAEAFNCRYKNIHYLACTTECLHSASLILDDIADGSEKRRGKDSCHVVFGADKATLGANRLIIASYEILNEYSSSRLRKKLIAEACSIGDLLIQGQCSDLVGNFQNQNQVIEMYKKKSGTLFHWAAKIGLLNSDIDDKLIRNFGYSLGVAYQIFDDIKDKGEDGDKITLKKFLEEDKIKEIGRKYKDETMSFVNDKFFLEELLNKMVCS